jgi:Fic family protein
MVRVAKKLLKGRTYYYLEHTIRDKGKRTTKSRYLGTKLPKDIDVIRREFEYELNKEKWFEDFQRIRRNYNVELRRIPRSAREKAVREFSIRFTYDTQRIEGSTLTLRETADLLEHGISPGGKPIDDAREAEAHNAIFHDILKLKKDLTQVLVQEWNWRLLKETKADVAGKIRRHGVRISGSRFVPPSPVELQSQLNHFFNWYNAAKSNTNPVELAGLVHLKFVTIHPFTDGNGRISRLMMNFVLHRNGYPMLNIEYNRRATYYTSLERSQLQEDQRPFMNWFFGRYKRENSQYLLG